MSSSIVTIISLGKSFNAGISFLYERISKELNRISSIGLFDLSSSNSCGNLLSMNLKESKYRTILSGRVVPFKIDIIAFIA